MQRYFIKNNAIKDSYIILSEEDLFHIRKVMRMQVGDQVTCVDELGHTYLCEIYDLQATSLKIIETLDENHELDIHVRLIYGMPKSDKFELVLQKCTELGVMEIVPLLSRKVVVKLDENKFEKKCVRYKKIIKEASEQSLRQRLVCLRNPIKIEEIGKYQADFNLVAYEEKSREGETMAFQKVLNEIQPGQWLNIVVGCEGGFEPYEVKQLEQLGYQACSLGHRILRSETAPIYMMSVIGFSRELGGK